MPPSKRGRRLPDWADDDRMEVWSIAMKQTREAERGAAANLAGDREGVQKSFVRLAVLAWEIARIAQEMKDDEA